jgi:hypothetical protein
MCSPTRPPSSRSDGPVPAEDPEVVDVAIHGVPSRMPGVGETDIVAALVVRDPAADSRPGRTRRAGAPPFGGVDARERVKP